MLSEYFTAENVELQRSHLHFAEYNPRTISQEALKTLRNGIRKFGLVGGIVVNKRTGNTIVQGHQRLTVMDDLQKYNADTHEHDYLVRADIIDIDEQAEKELVILLNNPNAQGEWDYDRLKAIVPTIDIANAGLSSVDLSMMGIGLEQNLAAIKTTVVPTVTSGMMSGVGAESALAGSNTESSRVDESEGDNTIPLTGDGAEVSAEADEAARQTKIQHMRDVKELSRQQVQERAENAMAYLMLSFNDMDNMQEFLARFNLPEQTQIIKGEDLLTMLEVTE